MASLINLSKSKFSYPSKYTLSPIYASLSGTNNSKFFLSLSAPTKTIPCDSKPANFLGFKLATIVQ